MFPCLFLPEESRRPEFFIIKFFSAGIIQIKHFKQYSFSVCYSYKNMISGISIS